MKERQTRKKHHRLNLLSKVQNPDDLEIGEVIKDKARGSQEQQINEESPDDLEVENNGSRKSK